MMATKFNRSLLLFSHCWKRNASTVTKKILPSMLSCDYLLTDQQKELRELVTNFAEKEIRPIAHQIDRDDVFPIELWPKMGNLGFLGPTAEEKYGGLELGYLDHILIMETLSKYSGSIALSYGAHSNLCVNQITRWGTDAQKTKYLPSLLDGTMVGGLSMSESNSGSDVVSLKTRAIEDGNKFIVNGTKMWCTNGVSAGLIILYAKTIVDGGSKGITAFIVETKKLKGFSIGKKLDKMGMRGSETCELIFDNVEIPKENILGELNKGVYVLMSGLESERLVLSSGPLGLMQACLDLSVSYSNERKQFDTPISQFQLIQGKIADMYTSLLLHRIGVYSTALAYKEEKASSKDCAAMILSSAEAATKAALDTIQILGGNGYTNEFPASRYLRDAKLYEIGAGTSEIRRTLIANEINSLLAKNGKYY